LKAQANMTAKIALILSALTGLPLCSLEAAPRNDGALWRPRLATPALAALDTIASRQFTAEVRASSVASAWSVTISNDLSAWSCQVLTATYSTINRGTEPGWQITASLPTNAPPELFTVAVSCSESVSVQSQALSVVPTFATDFYILHMADEQIVQEFHNAPSGQWYTTVGTAEEFNWEKEPINLINPRFVIATGDHIDFNGCFDAYNNWGNWATLYGANYNYQPSGTRYFTQQETSDIEAKLTSLYFAYHVFRVPYVECPGNHDVPPTSEYLKAPSPPYVYWHSIGASFYETNWGQRSWSFKMGDFYVLMHDWSEGSLKTWAASDYNAALNDPSIKYRMVGQHYNSDQAFIPSTCDLMLVGHGHTTATLQSSPYYIYEDGPAFSYGTCGFFNFRRGQNGWTCDQTGSARNTAKDVWPLYTDNGVTRKVRSNRADAMNITANSITITNDLPENFYDGRVRFILSKGTYNSATNGTILAQYGCNNGSKTAVLVKVNIPASGTITVSMGPASIVSATNSAALDPKAFGSRLKLSFSGYNRGEALANFPVLVSLGTNSPGFSYRQFASPSGGDLRFSDSSGTNTIFHEIDEWNTNGTSRVWVRVPQLASTNDFIWAYWGNPAATSPPAWATNGSVWSSDHFLVWHLKESGFPYADSAQQFPAFSGVTPSSASGLVGLGCALNGISQYLDAQAISLGSAFTLDALVKLDTGATNIQAIWANKPGGWNSAGFCLYVDSYNTTDQQLRLETGDGTSGLTATTATGAVSFGQWHHLAAVVDRSGGTAHLYVDGADRTQSSAIVTDFANQSGVNLGRFTNSAYYLKGTLDEVRIEASARSSDWVWASYMTTVSNSALASYSPVAQQLPALSLDGDASGLVLSWPANGVGFSLYAATNLTPPIPWARVANPVAFTNNAWQALLSPTSTAVFYHLKFD
jgi:hypothetical protein